MRGPFLRLALAGLRRRGLAALLTLALAAVTTAVLILALGLRSVADEPWERTFDATNGAHLLALGDRAVERLAELPGVVEAAAPVPGVITSFEHTGSRFGLNVQAAGAEPPRVERPVLIAGRWVADPGEIVIERSFASVLNLVPGDVLHVAASSGEVELVVVGVAVAAREAPYPDTQPGIGFVAREALEVIQSDPSDWIWTQAVRLAEPARADEVAARARLLFDPGSRVHVESWLERRSEAGEGARTTAIVLSTYSVLLLVAAGLVLVNLIGGRALLRHREIGLLKAIGFTPRLVTLLFLVEQLLLGLAGALVGAAAGVLLLPVVAGAPAALLGTTPTAASPARIAFAVLAVCVLVATATVLPTVRGARFSVLQALGAGRSRRSTGPAARSVGLREPLPLVLGLKEALGRSSRTALAALALALTVAALVAGLAFEATQRHEARLDTVSLSDFVPPPDPAGLAPAGPDRVAATDSTSARLRPIVHGLNGVLVLIATVNLLAIVVLSVRERTRDLGVLKALGLTPAQLRRSVYASQAVAVVAAAALGIPLGLGLFLGVYAIVNGDTARAALPPWWALAAVPFVVAAAVGLVAAGPARQAARLDVVRALAHE